jgi:hypothetical protein
MQGGIIPFAVLIFLYLLTVHDLVNAYESGADEGAWIRLSALLSICIAGMAEPFMFNNSFKNMSLILLGNSLYSHHCKAMNRYVIKSHDRELPVRIPDFSEVICSIGNAIGSFRKSLLLTFLVCGLAGAFAFGMKAHMPSEVYARQWMCNAEDHESLFFSPEKIDEMRDDPDIWVLDYQDEKDPMQVFDGRLITIEYYRGILSAFLLVGAGGFCIAVLIIWLAGRRKRLCD